MSSSFCEVYPNCAAIIASRVCIVLTFMVFGVIGNGVVLYIYRESNKKQQMAGKIYLVAMARMDIFAVLVTLPQTPFYEYQLTPDVIYLSQAFVMVTAYLFVQVSMVFDRVFAVFTPFQYLRYRDRFNKIMIGIYVLTALYLEVIYILYDFTDLDLPNNIPAYSLMTTYLLGFFVPSCAYPAIAIKLWRQKRKINAGNITSQQKAEANDTRAAHVKTLRLYSAVMGLFALAYIPNLIQGVTHDRSLTYFYSFNSIANPLIYYVFNEKFREDVKELASKLKHKIKP